MFYEQATAVPVSVRRGISASASNCRSISIPNNFSNYFNLSVMQMFHIIQNSN
jgi:hypothetical protein